MPDLQSPQPATGPTVPAMIEPVMPVFDDPDYAFGCECADPALHIAQWLQEASAAGA